MKGTHRTLPSRSSCSSDPELCRPWDGPVVLRAGLEASALDTPGCSLGPGRGLRLRMVSVHLEKTRPICKCMACRAGQSAPPPSPP